MPIESLAVQIVAYGLALWLGLYLLARNPAKPLLHLAGLGLATYALALAFGLLRERAPAPQMAQIFTRLQWALSFLPALFWSGALFQLVPENQSLHTRLNRVWSYVLAPLSAAFGLLALSSSEVVDFSAADLRAGPAHLLFAAIVSLPLLVGLILTARFFDAIRPRRPAGLIIAATLFFALGVGLLAFPLGWLPRDWTLLAIGVDLAVLGFAIAVLDAFDEGEAWLPDISRSFAASLLVVALFGGQVALAIALGAGLTFPLLALLLAIIAAAIATQTFADAIQAGLDNLIFARFPRLRRSRSDLRAATRLMPRLNEALDPQTLDEDEFVRLTRRALSHLGDLPRLAAGPLTRLPIVQERLAARGAYDDALERAAELKALLTESILRLKPRDRGDFGTSGEWRYYNALYFPYVVGLKPYSRRAETNHLDPIARQALDWFRASVPERTLHNWQNAAARLVAQELRKKGADKHGLH